MRRLTHSPTGLLRSLQVSQFSLFGFVEGKDVDPFFYGGLCKAVCTGHGVRYRIVTARELRWQGDGKEPLLGFYEYLRKNGKLLSSLGKKVTACMFFLDKDVDDILRRRRRSPHVVYTEHYDVHNHLFLSGDLLQAAAAAAHTDPGELQGLPMFSATWCSNAASRWEDWVAMCVFSKMSGSGLPGYRLTSQINRPLNGPVDNALLEQRLQELTVALGWSRDRVDTEFERTRRYIHRYYVNGRQDVVFKGKWYCTILEMDVRGAMAGRPVRSERMGERMLSTLAATMDFSRNWATPFREAVERIVARL